MTAPKRIQRKRTPGWRMPDGAIYVGRPSQWGNPFAKGTRVGPLFDELTIADESRAVLAFARWVDGWSPIVNGVPIEEFGLDLETLRGHDLACWCPVGSPCHGDVLLDLANRPSLIAPTPEVLATLPPRGPVYQQLSIPGTPSRPRRHGSTVRAHCTRCGRYAANPHRETDTGYCVVHGACHLTWG